VKRCLGCHTSFTSDRWECPACRRVPAAINGYDAFAPDAVLASQDFPAASHETLDALQDRSFWFRGRNALIVDLIRTYSGNARAVMEIGCGTGYVLAAIQSAFPEATLVGSEIHVSGLRHARKRLGDSAILLQMDARDIPYDQEFDVIGAFDVLEHIDDDRGVLAEITRALRPGGHAIVAVPQHPMLWSATDDYGHHKRRYRRRELRDKVVEAGLRLRLDTSFVAILFPAMLAQRLIRGRRRDYAANAELKLPYWLDETFEATLNTERALIMLGARFPFGGSRVVVAQRP
jgi:SAM-dependent methyltransferase